MDTTAVLTLPDSLIVDMRLCAPLGAPAAGVFYVSRVTARRLTLDVYISYKPTAGSAFEVGMFLNMGTAAGTNTSYSMVPSTGATGSFADMTGQIVIGIANSMAGLAGDWLFLYTATPLNITVVDEGMTQFRSLQVGDKRYYGNVVLREGPGVVITPMWDAGTQTTTLVLSASTLGRPNLTPGTAINTPEDLLQAVTQYYGVPITTINNVAPDDKGNMTLNGAECVSVIAVTGGIQVSNPCGKPCCSDDYLQSAMEAVNQINLKTETITKFYQAADQLLSQMREKLFYLEDQSRQY